MEKNKRKLQQKVLEEEIRKSEQQHIEEEMTKNLLKTKKQTNKKVKLLDRSNSEKLQFESEVIKFQKKLETLKILSTKTTDDLLKAQNNFRKKEDFKSKMSHVGTQVSDNSEDSGVRAFFKGWGGEERA